MMKMKYFGIVVCAKMNCIPNVHEVLIQKTQTLGQNIQNSKIIKFLFNTFGMEC
jgi:hypothetical protein